MRGATDEATEKLLGEVKEVFRGTPAREIARMAPEVLVGVLPRIYPEMLEEVYAHQDAGRPTFIVSAAGDELVQLLARILYMDGGIGTSYEVDEEGLLHRRARRHLHVRGGQGRGDARGSPTSTTSTSTRSYAYSDSVSDLPMLRAVGIPGGRQPRRGADPDRARRGLAGDAVRAPRPAAGARGPQRRPARRGTARTP